MNKKILSIFVMIMALSLFGVSCSNEDSTGTGGNNSGNTNDTTKPDGLASTYDGTWYFYSEDGKIKGDTITIANGGITGLKKSSGEAIDFVKDNFNSEVFIDTNPPASKNYVVYKDGYTGNINLNADIAYIKIKDSSKAVIIEGMLSKTQRSATIDATHVGQYQYTSTSGGFSYTLDVKTDSVSFAITSSSGGTEKTYKMPAAYFTKTVNSYTCNALNYPDTVLDFDNRKFSITYINVDYSASDANFSGVTSSSSRTAFKTVTYTKQ